MNSSNFGSLTTPASGLLGGRMRRAMPRMPMMSRRGTGVPSLGGLALMKMADGGVVHPSMTYLSSRDAMHSMPNMALPDYMLARMADGGQPDPFNELALGKRLSLARRARSMDPRVSASIDQIEQRPYDESNPLADIDALRDERFRWDPRMETGRDRQRTAMEGIANAGPRGKLEGLESRDDLHSMLASLIDPTMLPLMFAGTSAKGLSKLAPRMFRRIPGDLPARGRATEFGAWGAMPSNIRDAGAPESRFDLPWGYQPMSNQRLIGDR